MFIHNQSESSQNLYDKFQNRVQEFQDGQNQPAPLNEMDSPLMAVPTPAPIQWIWQGVISPPNFFEKKKDCTLTTMCLTLQYVHSKRTHAELRCWFYVKKVIQIYISYKDQRILLYKFFAIKILQNLVFIIPHALLFFYGNLIF